MCTHTGSHMDTPRHTYTCVHARTHIHTRTHIRTCTHTQSQVRARTHAHTHTYTHMHAHMHTHIHTCVYTHTRTRLHTYTCMHTHAHTQSIIEGVHDGQCISPWLQLHCKEMKRLLPPSSFASFGRHGCAFSHPQNWIRGWSVLLAFNESLTTICRLITCSDDVSTHEISWPALFMAKLVVSVGGRVPRRAMVNVSPGSVTLNR